MILGGDEFRRTQRGNNNAYCQDNDLSWFDWTLVDKHADIMRFTKGMIDIRKRCSAMSRPLFFSGEHNARGLPEVSWHGCRLDEPGWSDPGGRVLAFTLGGPGNEPDAHVILNMFHDHLEFEIPQVKGRRWVRAVDTSLPSPDDYLAEGSEVAVNTLTYTAAAYSSVILLSKPTRTRKAS